MKNPTTNQTLGIKNEQTKFRDVRKRARDEYINRYKSKRKRKPNEPRLYIPGTLVVASKYSGQNKKYILAEIIDFDSGGLHYGIVQKATFPCDRIGRIEGMNTGGFFYYIWSIENMAEKDIKWLEGEG